MKIKIINHHVSQVTSTWRGLRVVAVILGPFWQELGQKVLLKVEHTSSPFCVFQRAQNRAPLSSLAALQTFEVIPPSSGLPVHYLPIPSRLFFQESTPKPTSSCCTWLCGLLCLISSLLSKNLSREGALWSRGYS